MGNVVGAPSMLAAELKDPPTERTSSTCRAAMRAAGTIQQARRALGEDPVPPLAHRLGIDLEPFSGHLDRPASLEYAAHHPLTSAWCHHRVGVLAPSVGHEPSLRVVGPGRPTASLGGLNPSADHPTHDDRDNVPGRHN